MRWMKPNLKSIYGLLAHAPALVEPTTDKRMEDVRQAMLDAMALNGLDEKHGYLMSRIRYASNIDTLWYARTDLMMALAAEHGETRAHDRITAISHLFVGLVPAALAPRLATPPSLRPPPPPPTRPTRLSRLTARRR